MHYQNPPKCGRPASLDLNEALQGVLQLPQALEELVLHHLGDHRGDSYRNDSVSKTMKEYLQPTAAERHS